jgi:hypothetical protein
LNHNFSHGINHTYEKLKNWHFFFVYECNDENVSLSNQCKGENVLFDMITNIHNPLSQRLTNIHNSIENEVLLFKLNNLQIKEFYEFIIDPLFFIFQKNEIIYIYMDGVVGTRKNQSYKLFFLKAFYTRHVKSFSFHCKCRYNPFLDK